jgi:hypothetical protein
MKPTIPDPDAVIAELMGNPEFIAASLAVEAEEAATSTARSLRDRLSLGNVKNHHHRKGTRGFIEGELNAAAQIHRLPAPGETLHAITNGQFVGCDLLPAVLHLAKSTAREVILTTLSFSRQNVDLLCELLDSRRIKTLTILASTYFRRTGQNDLVYLYAKEQLEKRRQTLFAAHVHSKLILIATADNRHFTIETSANLRSCLCVEQFALTQDAGLYNFHKRWIRHVQQVVAQ